MTKVFNGYLGVDEFGFLSLDETTEGSYSGNALADKVADEFKPGSKVFVRYFITDKKTDEASANESLIHKTFGYDLLEAEYVLEAYSEVTIEEWHEDLKIGGHNLIDELTSYKGKYLILIIEEIGDESPYGNCL